MPFLAGLAPILTAVAAAGTLAETGVQLANSGGGSSSSTATNQAQLDQQKAQQAAAQKAAFIAAQPNVQSSTGGALSSTAFNSAAASQAGVPSDLNSIAQYLTNGGSGSASSVPVSGGTTTPNSGNQNNQADLQTLSDLLKAA